MDLRDQPPPQIIEHAWAAGFFDGEGTTSYSLIAKSTRIQISQKDPALLYRFQRAVGGGKVCGPYRNGKGEVYQFRVSRRADVLAVMAKLWPYLGDQKKDQARLANADPTFPV